jgi:hypothetical protein
VRYEYLQPFHPSPSSSSIHFIHHISHQGLLTLVYSLLSLLYSPSHNGRGSWGTLLSLNWTWVFTKWMGLGCDGHTGLLPGLEVKATSQPGPSELLEHGYLEEMPFLAHHHLSCCLCSSTSCSEGYGWWWPLPRRAAWEWSPALRGSRGMLRPPNASQ